MIIAVIDSVPVGMALLLRCTTLAGHFGMVEEVAVDTEARGRHVSVHLLIGGLRRAAELRLNFVDLTSPPLTRSRQQPLPKARLRGPGNQLLPPPSRAGARGDAYQPRPRGASPRASEPNWTIGTPGRRTPLSWVDGPRRDDRHIEAASTHPVVGLLKQLGAHRLTQPLGVPA